MLNKVKSDQTRLVLSASRWVIKLPRISKGWRVFLLGMLDNYNEKMWNRFNRRLSPMGLVLLMNRLDYVDNIEPQIFNESDTFTEDELKKTKLLQLKIYDEWIRVPRVAPDINTTKQGSYTGGID